MFLNPIRIFYLILATCLFLNNHTLAQSRPAEGSIKWMTLSEAIEKCKTEPKKLILDVYTDWCGWCKRMDAETFSNLDISRVVNQYYYAVKLNAEQREDIIFKEKVYKYIAQPNGRGYNEFAAYILSGQMSYPNIVYMDTQQNLIQAIPGYQQPRQIEPILVYFGGDHYKTTSWEKFQSEYKSLFSD